MDCGTDWGVILTVIACLFAMLSVMTGLFLYLAAKMDNLQREMHSMRQDLNLEIKDFHGRLCTIEERNKPSSQSL
jgi:hypothetical protein